MNLPKKGGIVPLVIFCSGRTKSAGTSSEQLLFRANTPGYRERADGKLTNVGNTGNVWSSAVSGINGVELWFNSAELNPIWTPNRAYGVQLRCLQAFTVLPLFISPGDLSESPGREKRIPEITSLFKFMGLLNHYRQSD